MSCWFQRTLTNALHWEQSPSHCLALQHANRGMVGAGGMKIQLQPILGGAGALRPFAIASDKWTEGRKDRRGIEGRRDG